VPYCLAICLLEQLILKRGILLVPGIVFFTGDIDVTCVLTAESTNVLFLVIIFHVYFFFFLVFCVYLVHDLIIIITSPQQ